MPARAVSIPASPPQQAASSGGSNGGGGGGGGGDGVSRTGAALSDRRVCRARAPACRSGDRGVRDAPRFRHEKTGRRFRFKSEREDLGPGCASFPARRQHPPQRRRASEPGGGIPCRGHPSTPRAAAALTQTMPWFRAHAQRFKCTLPGLLRPFHPSGRSRHARTSLPGRSRQSTGPVPTDHSILRAGPDTFRVLERGREPALAACSTRPPRNGTAAVSVSFHDPERGPRNGTAARALPPQNTRQYLPL